MEAVYSASRTVCTPVSPQDQCRPCTDEDQDQNYCVANGYKQEVHCSISGGALSNVSTDGYITFQPCPVVPGDFMSVVKFEFIMAVLFAVSYSFVTKRKRRLQAVQSYRLAQYV